MRFWPTLLFLSVTGCAGVTGFSDSNIAEKGQKFWVDPRAGGGLDHPLVSTLSISGFCCVALEPYNSTVRQFEIVGKRQTLGSGDKRLELFDVRFDDGYGGGLTQRAFVRQSDLHLFPTEKPLVVEAIARSSASGYPEFMHKTFWVNPKGITAFDFKGVPDTLAPSMKFDRKAKFAVVGVAKGRQSYTEWLHVKFEDGRNAYINVSGFSVADPDKFGNRAFADFIFPDDPDKIRTQLEKRGGVAVGMTKEQVLKSNWGVPARVNKTMGRNVEHEQWVYSSESYLYFDNGILTVIQTRE